MLVECVPNFSEGRDEGRVQRLVNAAGSVPGAALLDRHTDPDHHRTVLTLAGDPRAMSEAAFRAVESAVGEIDLRQHDGVHPRIGAADVVPFVPLDGATMADCVELARALGQRIGKELQVPVYLYGKAATSPERARLPWLRKPGFERLGRALASPERAPDFGPSRPHPTAGACVVGARELLLAINVELDPGTAVETAEEIARAVRESSGGLPGVQAKGLLLRRQGRVQVSMNLTQLNVTGPGVAYRAVCVEAARRGAAVLGSELVGLAPRSAYLEAARAILGLGPIGQKVLEERLDEAPLLGASTSLERWARELASEAPLAPGGGSAAGLALALGRACLDKAIRLSAGREGLPPPAPPASQAAHLELATADHLAWAGLAAARRRLKDAPGRAEALEAARREAVRVPEEALAWAVELAESAALVAERGNPHLRADAAAAAELALAAARVARLNARANRRKGESGEGDDRALAQIEAAVARVRAACG